MAAVTTDVLLESERYLQEQQPHMQHSILQEKQEYCNIIILEE